MPWERVPLSQEFQKKPWVELSLMELGSHVYPWTSPCVQEDGDLWMVRSGSYIHLQGLAPPIWYAQWGGHIPLESPKENHGALYRTWEGGDWPTVGVMVSRPMPPWSFSLCAFSGVFLSLCTVVGSESRTESLTGGINCEKWVPSVSYLAPGHPTSMRHGGSPSGPHCCSGPWACRQLTRPGLILPFGHQAPPLG